MNNENLSVVVVDDHHLTRAGIVTLVEANPKIKVLGEGWVGEHIFELLEKYRPDILITDLQMLASEDSAAIFEPIATLQKVIKTYQSLSVIVISQGNSIQTIQSLAEIGVKGYMLKTDNFTLALDRAVEMIHLGVPYFSPEIREVIRSSPKLKPAAGLSPRELAAICAIVKSYEASREEVAASLDISVSTLKKHITSIIKKLNVKNMESAVVKAIRMGLVDINELVP